MPIISAIKAMGDIYKTVKNNSKTTKKTTTKKTTTKTLGSDKEDIKTNHVVRKNFIPIGGEAKRGVVSTKSETPIYKKLSAEDHKFLASMNSKPTAKKTIKDMPAGYTTKHVDGSYSTKDKNGSVTKYSVNRVTGGKDKVSITDSKGNTKFFGTKDGKEVEVKPGYVKTVKDLKAEGKGSGYLSSKKGREAMDAYHYTVKSTKKTMPVDDEKDYSYNEVEKVHKDTGGKVTVKRDEKVVNKNKKKKNKIA